MITYKVTTTADIEMGNGWLEVEADSPEDAAAKHGPLYAADYFGDGWEDHVGELGSILVQDGDTSPVHAIAVKYM